MIVQANNHRIERSFNVGDKVYLRLQPYHQSSVVSREVCKLAAKYFGPYKVLEKIGEVAYKLELTSTTAIHPVFHVSQLKRALSDEQPAADLPSFTS